MFQPKCGFPYDQEAFQRQARDVFARENGFGLSSGGSLNSLPPRLLKDAGYCEPSATMFCSDARQSRHAMCLPSGVTHLLPSLMEKVRSGS